MTSIVTHVHLKNGNHHFFTNVNQFVKACAVENTFNYTDNVF